MTAGDLLAQGLAAALAAVAVDRAMPQQLPRAAGGRLMVIAIGKAAVPLMAAAQSRSAQPLAGLVVAPHGHVPPGTGWPGVEVLTAGHPQPDADSVVAGERALALATRLGVGDHLLMLVSGGGSSVLAAPAAGISLDDKAALTAALLRSGAAIAEINVVRQALSRVKGGRLAAAAAPARVTTWIVSDIPGDDPALVASGPTIAGGGDPALAQAVLAKLRIAVPAAVSRALAQPLPVPPVPGDMQIIASAAAALAAVGDLFAAAGYVITNLGDALQGEARQLGAAHAALALQLAGDGRRHAIISGGETSVTVASSGGRGGRNLEYCLGLAIALDGALGITALASDSDGIDGSSHAAGARVRPETLSRGRALGLDARAHLAANDAHGYFAVLGDLVVTGPTLTNVNDIRIILVG